YGGLYIHSGGLKWNRFSADIGGGTIQFVMHMENKSWVEAIKELLNLPATQYNYSTTTQRKIPEKESVKKIFKIPKKNETYKHIFAYLINTRKIDKQIVYDLVKLNMFYENKYHNSCVFVGYDLNGEAKYAAIRGTSPTMQYRKDVAGSDKSVPFAVNIRPGSICTDKVFRSNCLYAFESPIDLMSYLSLLKLHKIEDFDAHFISLGGVCDLALERFLNEHPNVKEITLGLDNDEAGRFACQQIRQKYGDKYSARRHLPENKDFNEDLIKLSGKVSENARDQADEKVEMQEVSDESEMLLHQ
ncbi:MAG TPA: DUF3991 domain-containing protein, partial [Clostridia bacterium]